MGILNKPLAEIVSITASFFSPNPAFVSFMNALIAREGPNTRSLIEAAKRQGDGYIYLIDQRTIEPQGEVPAQDVIGAFQVVSGQVDPKSYKPSTNHKILTEDGFVQLGNELQDILLMSLSNLAEQAAGGNAD